MRMDAAPYHHRQKHDSNNIAFATPLGPRRLDRLSLLTFRSRIGHPGAPTSLDAAAARSPRARFGGGNHRHQGRHRKSWRSDHVNQPSLVLRKQLLKAGGRYLERRARARLRGNPGLWSMLQAYLEQTGSTGCRYADYEALHDYVRGEKPREILECGTGVSTVVIAHALMENAEEDRISGRVTSMEESELWFEMAARLLPDSLREHVDLLLSPRVEEGYLVFRGVRYRDVPDRRYEFVFTDGPSTKAPSDGTRCADFDYLHVVRNADHPVFGIIDKRLSTCYVLQKVFGDKFRYDPYRELGYVGPCTRNDMRTLTRSSSVALSESERVLRRTRFHLVTEPPRSAVGDH